MNEKSLRVLEFDKIVDMIISNAQSELGKEKLKRLRPINNIEEIRDLIEETDQAFKLLVKRGRPPLFGIYDLEEALSFSKKGGRLGPESLLRIAENLRVVRALKDYMDEEEEESEYSLVQSLISSLFEFRFLEDEIERSILSEDEIADDASTELKSIRMALRKKSDDIKIKLNSIVTSKDNQTALQEQLVTVRDGRYVVPVRSEYRSKFKGVVHDQSSSGATVFIEPMAIVELNNEIRVLELREEEEISRILKRLTSFVAQKADEILNNQKILEQIDAVFAKASFALQINANKPILNDKGYINLKNASHPLLKVKKKVPISVELGDRYTSLVITGPNTGGKTVSIKTVGLLTLMAQAGLFIPADECSELAVFDEVFSDIGDEQSIEQSLSTFSSHMTNIVKILEKVQDNSLVLFDELGAGTDPTEGAALAMAILDLLLNRKIRTIATTHYSQLKLYALSTEGVINGSVEFDVDSLRPTYRLLIGIPGKSNAFEISKRLGLSNSIIDYAKELISNENKEFEDVLSGIEKDRKIIELSRLEIEKEREEIATLRSNLKEEIDKTKARREKIIDKANDEAYEILVAAREESKDILKELNDMRDSSSRDMKKANQLNEKLRKKTQKHEKKKLDFLNVDSGEDLGQLKLGDEVEVISMGQTGYVVELPDAKGNLLVEIGILKVASNIKQLRRVAKKEIEKSNTSIRKIIQSVADKQIESEIDLRGMTIEEAIIDVDKFLDNAYIMKLKEVRIIHGKGTGALRVGINDYLRKHKLVAKKRSGTYSEGFDGVTIVTLK